MQILLATFNSHWEPLVWFALGILGALGVVALFHPRRVTTLALRENGWVESPPGGIDLPASGSFVALAVCRLFGVGVLVAVAAIAYFVAHR